MDMQHGDTDNWTCCKDMALHHGHGHGQQHAAQTWTGSIDMEMLYIQVEAINCGLNCSFFLNGPSWVIEVYSSPGKYRLVYVGELTVQLCYVNLIFHSDGFPAAVE
jgi:hypothetical protein